MKQIDFFHAETQINRFFAPCHRHIKSKLFLKSYSPGFTQNAIWIYCNIQTGLLHRLSIDCPDVVDASPTVSLTGRWTDERTHPRESNQKLMKMTSLPQSHVITFDYRGFGESDSIAQVTEDSMVEDVLAIYAFVESKVRKVWKKFWLSDLGYNAAKKGVKIPVTWITWARHLGLQFVKAIYLAKGIFSGRSFQAPLSAPFIFFWEALAEAEALTIWTGSNVVKSIPSPVQ